MGRRSPIDNSIEQPPHEPCPYLLSLGACNKERTLSACTEGDMDPSSYFKPTISLVPVWTPLRALTPGTKIELHGRIHHTKRFEINLETGNGDIAFHINPRFDDNEVVLNSLRSGQWETEERAPLTLVQGEEFSCLILVEKVEYKIIFNGLYLTSFKHRLLCSLVEVLTVDNGITLEKVLQEAPTDVAPTEEVLLSTSLDVAPRMAIGIEGTPPQASSPPPAHPVEEPIYNPPTPFVYELAHGCYPGLQIYISGQPYREPDRFEVNLSCGPHIAPTSPVAFHWNPRFHCKTVVRNAFLNGNWGTEEREGRGFPYKAGTHFHMVIEVLHGCFNVAVYGEHYAEFRHRFQPISEITHLHIRGDISISLVMLK